jgi:hypothetical protein
MRDRAAFSAFAERGFRQSRVCDSSIFKTDQHTPLFRWRKGKSGRRFEGHRLVLCRNFVAPRNRRLPRVHSIGGVKSDAFTKKASFSAIHRNESRFDFRTPPRTQRVSLLAFTEPTFSFSRT